MNIDNNNHPLSLEANEIAKIIAPNAELDTYDQMMCILKFENDDILDNALKLVGRISRISE
ncbi:MAG: hypothetical protein BWY74_03052 [Firmicutes bacterium ADurb.Bin419]|nr:MAG: hypothetical protein BWY74_03052 [Firmicutes bacterium ADurb.Bin419]